MHLDFAALTPAQRYKLLVSTVLPRPIAFVTSVNADGVVNAAPYSFFNCFGADPGVVVIGVADRPEGGPKDTAANAESRGRFVVNLVDEPLAVRMNHAATDFPAGVSEPAEVGLTLEPMEGTDVPRLAESPVSYACNLHKIERIGGNRLVIGTITSATFRPGLVEPDTLHVDTAAWTPIGRMSSPAWYCRTADRFELPRVSYAQWQEGQR